MDPRFLIEVQALAASLDQLDYFAVLAVPQTATPAQVKEAYYRQSRAFHPDRFAAVPDPALRATIARIYRRVNEAYTVLRDDRKRLKYAADLGGPDRKLRFTEADEQQVKEEQKRKVEEQFGTTPNGRKFYAAALGDLQAERWDAAERAIRSALMYEPANAKFKELLAQIEKSRPKGDAFKIR
jgi:curved DNA-binding protein CbpA